MARGLSQEAGVAASGSLAQIERWGELLRRVKIRFEVRRFCDDHRPIREDHAELWVDQDDVDEVRSTIRGAEPADGSLLW